MPEEYTLNPSEIVRNIRSNSTLESVFNRAQEARPKNWNVGQKEINYYNRTVTPVAKYNQEHGTGFQTIDQINDFENFQKQLEDYYGRRLTDDELQQLGRSDYTFYDTYRDNGMSSKDAKAESRMSWINGTLRGTGEIKQAKPFKTGYFEDTAKGQEMSRLWNNVVKPVGGLTGSIALLGGAFGAVPQLIADVGYGIGGAKNLASKEGIPLTVDLIKNGQYGAAAVNGALNLLNAGFVVGAGQNLNRFTKEFVKPIRQSLGFSYPKSVAAGLLTKEMAESPKFFNFVKNHYRPRPTNAPNNPSLRLEYPGYQTPEWQPQPGYKKGGILSARGGRAIKSIAKAVKTTNKSKPALAKTAYESYRPARFIAGDYSGPESWIGVEYLTPQHYGFGGQKPIIEPFEVELPKPPVTVKSNLDKFLEKSVEDQNEIVRYWNGENYSTFSQLKGSKDYNKFIKWLDRQ